jgi:proline racemase
MSQSHPYETEFAFDTIETHTAGEPTRIVVDGLDEYLLTAGSAHEQMVHLARNHDWIREALMEEPRGHADMFGAFLVPPASTEADVGVVFTDANRYGEMCGHATIGLVTALIGTGRLPPKDEIVVETPAGLVTARPTVEDGTVTDVAVRNVDAFVYDTVTLDPRGHGPVQVDVVCSGINFLFVDVADVGLTVDPDRIDDLRSVARALLDEAERRVDVDPPFEHVPPDVDAVHFYQEDEPDRNVVMFGDDLQVDRSPCGTGTCGKVTLLYTDGSLDRGEAYPYESVIGTRFTGRVVDAEEREGYTVVTPEVRGSAHVVGQHTFVKRPDDPVDGFTL